MKLYTLKQFCAEFQAFSLGGLRNQIFNEKINGLKESGAILRMGRRVLIDSDKFFDWVKSKQV